MDSNGPMQGIVPYRQRLSEVAALFLRLGITAFGGPAAHIAMMHDETVKRRKWLSEQEFLDMLGATNLIPGPNSTEMAIHLGLLRAGWGGLVVAGCSFILPAMCIVTGMAWAYVHYGSMPAMDGVLYGVKPVMIAIIAKALWDLGKKAVKNRLTLVVGCSIFMLTFSGIHEIALLFVGGLAVLLVEQASAQRKKMMHGVGWPLALLALPAAGSAVTAFSLSGLFLTFLKIGSVLYGSGYVLLAFMRADFVERLGWLTDQQLIDAIAIGQVTPGPVFTTATFVGYLLGGLSGGVAATLGIFLPSFIFVALVHRYIPMLRRSPSLGSLLDGVNVASLSLMAAVSLQLGRASLVDPFTISLALLSCLLLLVPKLNTTWLVAGGALLGWGFRMVF